MSIMPMIDMEMSDDEKIDSYMPLPTSEKPKYPWGLKICLTSAELEKLKLDCEDAFVGGVFHIHALAEITCVSKTEMEDGSCQERLEATLTHMAVESEDAENMEEDRGMSALYNRKMA